MESMTLAKALVELKLLTKRIEKRSDELKPVAVKQAGKLLSTKLTQTEFEKNAKACWQSVRDLMARRSRIKSALVVANATVQVKICGKDYTLAEAIEQKQMMKLEETIICSTREKFAEVKFEMEEIERNNDAKLQKLLESVYGGAGKERSVAAEDHDAVATPFKKANEPTLVDPLDCEKMLRKIEEEMENFLAEVDVCLSVANATNSITI